MSYKVIGKEKGKNFVSPITFSTKSSAKLAIKAVKSHETPNYKRYTNLQIRKIRGNFPRR